MAEAMHIAQFDWSVRDAVYQEFAAEGRAPSADVLAKMLRAERAEVQAALERLHDRHALFLDPADRSIRMANPFSNVPTPFRVRANGREYWANCAWDALGIPAALHADAEIDATYADSGEVAAFAIEQGALRGPAVVVHFPLPASRWYDDLIQT